MKDEATDTSEISLKPQQEVSQVSSYLYSSLMPYPMAMSGSSVMTVLAAAFMRSSALLSFGFSKPYFAANLDRYVSERTGAHKTDG